MSYTELGNMNAEIVEAIWTSYLTRKALAQIEDDRKQQILSLRSNGMIDAEGMEKQMKEIQDVYEKSKKIVLDVDQDVAESNMNSPFMQAAKA